MLGERGVAPLEEGASCGQGGQVRTDSPTASAISLARSGGRPVRINLKLERATNATKRKQHCIPYALDQIAEIVPG